VAKKGEIFIAKCRTSGMQPDEIRDTMSKAGLEEKV
jgi:hypothetical protein